MMVSQSTMLLPSLPAPQVEHPALKQMLLVEKVHYTFETWFIKLFQAGLIPENENFSIIGMRQQYISLCWKEEVMWKKWSENVSE